MSSHHIELASYRLVGWLCLSLFGIATIASLLAGQRGPAAAFLVFALVGLYIILGAGNFDLTDEYVVHRSAFGEWRIRWDEVTAVLVGRGGGTFVFKNAEKCFVLSPPSWWSGRDRDAAIQFLMTQLERYRLEPTVSPTADYTIMKNTRVQPRPN